MTRDRATHLPARARRAVALTQAGLWWERLARAFWPAGCLTALGLAWLGLGLVPAIPAAALPFVAAFWLLAIAAALIVGQRRFRRPTSPEALARVDRTLPGRPLTTLGDRMALGGPGAGALWQAHQAQAQAAAATARPVAPDAGLAQRDPFALRLVALTALVMAAIFGGAGPAGQSLAAIAGAWRPVAARPDAVATGPSWEGWAEPPAHTRRPTIYLNAQKGDALDLPEGSTLTFRLYGRAADLVQDIGPTPATSPPARRGRAGPRRLPTPAARPSI